VQCDLCLRCSGPGCTDSSGFLLDSRDCSLIYQTIRNTTALTRNYTPFKRFICLKWILKNFSTILPSQFNFLTLFNNTVKHFSTTLFNTFQQHCWTLFNNTVQHFSTILFNTFQQHCSTLFNNTVQHFSS